MSCISSLQRMLEGYMAVSWMSEWKIVRIRNLMDAILNLISRWNFEEEMELKGFINIYRMRHMRRTRRARRQYLDLLWCDESLHKKWEKRASKTIRHGAARMYRRNICTRSSVSTTAAILPRICGTAGTVSA